jgi:hypothetical protein
MTNDIEEKLSAEEMQARIKTLEARVKRVANERNAARSSYARLAKVAEPFSNQSAQSLRHWLDSTPSDVVFRLSKAIKSTLENDTAHRLTFQILKTSERLSVAIEAKRSDQENTDADNIEMLASRTLTLFDKMHDWDS